MLAKTSYYLSLYFGIIFLSFVFFHVIPDDPARTILGPNASQEQVAELRKELGFDKPYHQQLLHYVTKAISLQFGNSYVDGRNVAREVINRFTVSIILIAVTIAIIFVYLIVVILSSQSKMLRSCVNFADFLLSSQPIFFSGIFVALLSLYFYPFTYFSGAFSTIDDFFFILPAALVTSFYPAAILSGILKGQLKLSLQSSYVVAARAMGVSEIAILFKHALRNCLIALLAAFSNILPSLLTGAFIIEIIFSLPGIGTLLLNSILMRDLPMLQCLIVVNGAFFIVVNLLFEILYPMVDPRITGAESNVSA